MSRIRTPKPFANEDWNKFRSLEGMVRLALIAVWDPIGVFGYPQTLDEYDSYVLPVVRLLIAGATVDEIEAHLKKVRVGMSIGSNTWTVRQDRLTAEILIAASRKFAA